MDYSPTAGGVRADGMRRDWIGNGCAALEQYGITRARFVGEMLSITWHELDGRTVPACPGLAINAAIREYRVPRVSAVAWDGVVDGRDEDGGAVHASVYGIEGNYKNGRVRLHVLDWGSALAVVCADVYPPGWAPSPGRVSRDFPVTLPDGVRS